MYLGGAVLKSDNVNRQRGLKVYLSDLDRVLIEEKAGAHNLSVSSYLRKTGLGLRPKPALNHQTALELIKVNGDLGRLGGLLKLWLSDREDEGAEAIEVRHVLKSIESTMNEIRQKAAIL